MNMHHATRAMNPASALVTLMALGRRLSRQLLWALPLAAVACGLTAAEPDAKTGQVKPEAGFTAIFNGIDLTGWEGNKDVWHVENHTISGGSLKGNPCNEFLCTLARQHDFDLRCDYKLIGSEGFVNSGIQFWSERVANSPEMNGYQADIGAGYTGSLYDESRRNKTLIRPTAEFLQRNEHPGEWNSYEVIAQAPHVTIILNGEKTIEYTESDAGIPYTGIIGLQIHAGPNAQVFFRNLRIKDLASAH